MNGSHMEVASKVPDGSETLVDPLFARSYIFNLSLLPALVLLSRNKNRKKK